MIEYILKKSNRKGKRYVIIMENNMSHHFGSDVGQTFIDHQNKDKKIAWEARHSNDKNWNQQHSGIYHSRMLLWKKPTLNESIKNYENKFKIKIKNQI